MIPAAARWALGLGASALLHLAAGAALLVSLIPDPTPQQPSPQSSLNLQAHRIPRSQAVPQPAEGAQAAESTGQSQGVTAGDIPRTRARPQAPTANRLPAAPPPAATLSTAAPAATAAVTSPPPSSPKLAATSAPSAPLAAASAQTQSATASAPLPQAATAQPLAVQTTAAAPPAPLALPAAPPTTPALPAAIAAAPAAMAAPPDAAALPQSPPSSQPSPALPPDAAQLATAPAPSVETPPSQPAATHLKAALAFQGADSGDVDPLSLAAFQSFMQPGDVAADADPLRDGLSGILAAVPCARLQVAFQPDTATLEIRGHLPEDGLRSPVLAALQAQMGADITVSDQMRLLPRPQCGALAGIATVGLPQSTDQITNPLLVGDDAHARVLDYSGGDRLFFDLTAPDYPAYVYVDYFDAGGQVLHLSPNELVPLTQAAPKSALRVGAKQPQDPGLQITVGPPYGQEIAVAFAASHVLFEHPRPLSEPAAPYLDALRDRIAKARTQHTDFKGEWVYFLITTHAP